MQLNKKRIYCIHSRKIALLLYYFYMSPSQIMSELSDNRTAQLDIISMAKKSGWSDTLERGLLFLGNKENELRASLRGNLK